MGKRLDQMNDNLMEFIRNQKMFFVATAGSEGRVNISPKGLDSLRVINENKVIWLNLTGSGNETAPHLFENGRMTLMFCAFEGKPLILRLYGNASVYHQRDTQWRDYTDLFPEYISARQIIELSIDLVQTSCGFGVPFYEYQGDRDLLTKWPDSKGADGIRDYQEKKNMLSLDGNTTNIFSDGWPGHKKAE